MVEFPQSVPNLTDSSTNLYEAIKGRNLVVYTDDEIRLAVSRCIAVETSRGWRIAKEKQSHKIDVVVALAQASLGAVQQGQGSVRIESNGPRPRRQWAHAAADSSRGVTTIDSTRTAAISPRPRTSRAQGSRSRGRADGGEARTDRCFNKRMVSPLTGAPGAKADSHAVCTRCTRCGGKTEVRIPDPNRPGRERVLKPVQLNGAIRHRLSKAAIDARRLALPPAQRSPRQRDVASCLCALCRRGEPHPTPPVPQPEPRRPHIPGLGRAIANRSGE
jgi:hypothetical protein